MAPVNFPDRYLLANDQQTKELAVILEIEGCPFYLSTVPIFKRFRYGDPDLYYGQTNPPLVYGGLIPRADVLALVDLQGSSLSLSQKVEPESGKGSISNLSFQLVDKDQRITQLVAPGSVIDELLGGPSVRVYQGFADTSFPEDYVTIFRGYCSDISYQSGQYVLSLSDANIKRREKIADVAKTKSTASIASGGTSLILINTAKLPAHVLGPAGTYDTTIRTFVQVEEEWMEYGPGALTDTTVAVQRGASHARGTAVVGHPGNADVSSGIELQGHVLDLALKIMLSGWGGPWKSGVVCDALVRTGLPELGDISNAILPGVSLDLVEDMGLTVGDLVTVEGSTAGNDGTYTIVEIMDLGDRPNRILLVDRDLAAVERPATGVTLAFRSQYDTLPDVVGLRLTPAEIDVQAHIDLRNLYLSGEENTMRIFMNSSANGKEFIETEFFKPLGIYSLTRFGRLSVGITRPPIAGERLVILSADSILNPEKIIFKRGLNNRRYYSEVQYEYDVLDTGEFSRVEDVLDSEAISKITISSVLKISSRGLKSDLSALTVINRRGQVILNRYKNAAFELQGVMVNWLVGSLLQPGDVVALQDLGTLHLPNMRTGERDLGVVLLEVIDCNLDIKKGNATLKLLGNLGADVTDRYATISPSSYLDGAISTVNTLKLKDSFGSLYGVGKEYKKWTDLFQMPVVIHNADWSRAAEVTLTGQDLSDLNTLTITPDLPWVPSNDDILDVAYYPASTDPIVAALEKLLYAHLSPTLTVTGGTSDLVFSVSAPDAALLIAGSTVTVHNTDFTRSSREVVVASVVSTTVTVQKTLGFTPQAGDHVEFIGFPDGGGAYRFV